MEAKNLVSIHAFDNLINFKSYAKVNLEYLDRVDPLDNLISFNRNNLISFKSDARVNLEYLVRVRLLDLISFNRNL